MEINELEINFPFGLLVIDYKGAILYSNAFARLKLHHPEKSSKVQHLFPNSNIIRVIKNGEAEVSTHSFDSMYYLLEFPLEIKNIGVIVLIPEITFQNVIEQSPKYTALIQEIESVMNLSGELVTITDQEGYVLRVSNTCEKLMGLKKSEFEGKSVIDLEKSGVINLSSTIKVLKTKQGVTLQQVTKSGRRLLVKGYPIYNDDGELNKVVNISRDITEIDDLKSKLAEINNTLSYYQKELNILQKKSNNIVFKSKAMEEVYELATRVADVDATVLIQGETGVGKEVLARTIHDLSVRKDMPFIKVNCGAIPEGLIESELFGYSKGTFTGANKEGKIGLVQAANNGTLFLDEIGELPLNLQAKLLQVLQEKQFTPLGKTKEINVNVRFIAATNKSLEDMVRKGSFREDLYYRLFVIPITIPPLSERKQDIPFLISYFVEQNNQKYKCCKRFDKEVIEFFTNCEWKGNVRELQNSVERLILTVSDDLIEKKHLPDSMLSKTIIKYPINDLNLKSAMNKYEKQIIINAVDSSSTLKEASEKLGIDASTIGRKVKKHSISIAKLQSTL